MKITSEHYLKALQQIPKLRKAERIVSQWENAREALKDKLNGLALVKIEIDKDGKVQATCQEVDLPKTA